MVLSGCSRRYVHCIKVTFFKFNQTSDETKNSKVTQSNVSQFVLIKHRINWLGTMLDETCGNGVPFHQSSFCSEEFQIFLVKCLLKFTKINKYKNLTTGFNKTCYCYSVMFMICDKLILTIDTLRSSRLATSHGSNGILGA